jgi:ABC-type amino acid transport substrate-binding protein
MRKGCLLGLALAVAAGPAAAVDSAAQFKVMRLRAVTPSCAGNGGSVVGRVSGWVGFGASGGRLTGFEGCFDDMASCTAWRLWAIGSIDGRVVYNACEPR